MKKLNQMVEKLHQRLEEPDQKLGELNTQMNPRLLPALSAALASIFQTWTLTSLMLPMAPDAKLQKNSNPQTEAPLNYQLIHIEAYIVYLDFPLEQVTFKLTSHSVDALINYYEEVHCMDILENTYALPDNRKPHDDFLQAINEFVYQTHVSTLDAGGLLCEEELGTIIMNLFTRHRKLPLLREQPSTHPLYQRASSIEIACLLEGFDSQFPNGHLKRDDISENDTHTPAPPPRNPQAISLDVERCEKRSPGNDFGDVQCTW